MKNIFVDDLSTGIKEPLDVRSDLQVSGVLTAFHERYLDQQHRDYYSLIDLYTAPGERTYFEYDRVQRISKRLLDRDALWVARVAISAWDSSQGLEGRLWPAYLSALGQMGLHEQVSIALSVLEDDIKNQHIVA